MTGHWDCCEFCTCRFLRLGKPHLHRTVPCTVTPSEDSSKPRIRTVTIPLIRVRAGCSTLGKYPALGSAKRRVERMAEETPVNHLSCFSLNTSALLTAKSPDDLLEAQSGLQVCVVCIRRSGCVCAPSSTASTLLELFDLSRKLEDSATRNLPRPSNLHYLRITWRSAGSFPIGSFPGSGSIKYAKYPSKRLIHSNQRLA